MGPYTELINRIMNNSLPRFGLDCCHTVNEMLAADTAGGNMRRQAEDKSCLPHHNKVVQYKCISSQFLSSS